MNPPSDHSNLPARGHLIVLRPLAAAAADAPRSAALLLTLMARAGRLTIVEDAPAVMVELHRGADAILLAGSVPADTRAELIAAATRFYPRVSLWQTADRDGTPAVTPIVSVASVSATTSPHASLEELHAPASSASATSPSRKGGASSPNSSRNLPGDALVTEEELAMLMSPLTEGGGR